MYKNTTDQLNEQNEANIREAKTCINNILTQLM